MKTFYIRVEPTILVCARMIGLAGHGPGRCGYLVSLTRVQFTARQ